VDFSTRHWGGSLLALPNEKLDEVVNGLQLGGGKGVQFLGDLPDLIGGKGCDMAIAA